MNSDPAKAGFPFSLHHLFEGDLSREQVASACLAMLLEGSLDVRRRLFELVAPQEAEQLAHRPWRVRVEIDDIDVVLEADGLRVLVENKVASGSKQSGQLLKYYRRARNATTAERLFAVFLAPHGIGRDEVARVNNSTDFQRHPGDLAAHVSWHDLFELPAEREIPMRGWIESVWKLISRAIEEAASEKYIATGEREVIRSLVDRVATSIRATSAIPLRRWSGRGQEEIFSVRTPITLSTCLRFESDEKPPFEVQGVLQSDGKLKVELRSYLSLAVKARKNSPLAQWWRDVTLAESIDVPSMGILKQHDHSYFQLSRELCVLAGDLEVEMVKAWNTLEQFVAGRMEQAHFPFPPTWNLAGRHSS